MQDWEYALIGAGIGGAGGYMLKDKMGLVIGAIGGGLLGYITGLFINGAETIFKGIFNNPITNPLQFAQNFWGSVAKNTSSSTQSFLNIFQNPLLPILPNPITLAQNFWGSIFKGWKL